MSVAELADRLPGVPTLRRWSQSLAVLDMILSPSVDFRYYAFDAHWSDTEQLASMSNGSGDEYSIVFGPAGVYVRGFDHESRLSPWAREPMVVASGLIDALPPSLRDQVDEPAFVVDGVPSLMVCLWREPHDTAWSFGAPSDPDLHQEDGGASWLFAELDGRRETYVEFAADYYEVTVGRDEVEQVLDHQALTDELITRINADADPDAVRTEARACGYP